MASQRALAFTAIGGITAVRHVDEFMRLSVA